MSLDPFTQPVQGRNVAPLFCLTVLYKMYEHRIKGHCYSAFKLAEEVPTEPNRHLCKMVKWGAGRMGQGCDVDI